MSKEIEKELLGMLKWLVGFHQPGDANPDDDDCGDGPALSCDVAGIGESAGREWGSPARILDSWRSD